MTRPEWERLRAQEGKLVEVDLERAPAGDVGEAASAIASLAAEHAVHTERIEVWRYHPTEPPTASDVQVYLRASTEDSPKLRKHLREHVFIVKDRPDKGRWEPKARALERIVLMPLRNDEAGRTARFSGNDSSERRGPGPGDRVVANVPALRSSRKVSEGSNRHRPTNR